MAAYRAQTEPLLPYYGARGVLRKVDGMAAMDEVYRQISGGFGGDLTSLSSVDLRARASL